MTIDPLDVRRRIEEQTRVSVARWKRTREAIANAHWLASEMGEMIIAQSGMVRLVVLNSKEFQCRVP